MVAFRILAILVGVVAALGASELGIRLLRRPDPATSPAGSARAIAKARSKVASCYTATPWRFPFAVAATDLFAVTLPFTEEPLWNARHNSSGFRTPEYTISRSPDSFRFVVVGDSFSWGQGVAMEETYVFQLGRLLSERGLPDAVKPEAINLGVCGHRYVDNLMKLLLHGASLEPDLVILQVLWNDVALVDPFTVSQAWAEVFPSFTSRVGRTLEAARMVDEDRKTRATFDAFARAYAPGSRDRKVAEETFQEFESFRKRTGIPVVAVAFPNLRPGYAESSANSTAEILDPPFQELLSSLETRGVQVVRLADAFRREARDRSLVVSETDFHPSAAAHEIAAHAIHAALLRSNLLQPRRTRTDPGWKVENALRRDAAEHWGEYAEDASRQAAFHERVLSIHPGDAWTTFLLAESCLQLGRREEGARLFRSLVDLEPKYAAPWHELSLVAQTPAEKRDLLEQMLAAVPDHTPALEDLARLDFAEGRREEGCNLLSRVARMPRYTAQLERARAGLEQNGCDLPSGPFAESSAQHSTPAGRETPAGTDDPAGTRRR